MLGAEAERDVAQGEHGAQQEAAGDEQDEGEGELGDDQDALETVLRSSGAGLCAVLA